MNSRHPYIITEAYPLYLVLTVLFLFGTSASAEENLFPVSRQIEKNVNFWTKIYAVYPTSSVVIHDRNDLSVIYTVVNLDDYFDPSVELREKWSAVDQQREIYVSALMSLSEMTPPIAVDSLDAVQLHVYIAWAHVQDDGKYARAVENIRGQVGLSDRFPNSIRRSGRYWNYIVEILEDYNLPLDLAYLPHVESLFDYSAHSKAGAAGVWQFITHTGRLFLTINDAVDERLDPISASVAAAKLLKKNFHELGSWPLAITAYNHGLGGMRAARQQFGNQDFGVVYEHYKSRTFGFASRNFYAQFLAATYVAKNHETYFGPIDKEPPIVFQSVQLREPLYVRQAAELFEVSIDTLIHYNRAFRKAAISNTAKLPVQFHLKLPYREGYDPREALAQQTPAGSVRRTPAKPAASQASGAPAAVGNQGETGITLEADAITPASLEQSSEPPSKDRSQ